MKVNQAGIDRPSSGEEKISFGVSMIGAINIQELRTTDEDLSARINELGRFL